MGGKQFRGRVTIIRDLRVSLLWVINLVDAFLRVWMNFLIVVPASVGKFQFFR